MTSDLLMAWSEQAD